MQPGWHLAIDLANMLLVSEAIAKAALERKEFAAATATTTPARIRLGRDQPHRDPGRRRSIVDLKHQPLPVMPYELKTLFEEK